MVTLMLFLGMANAYIMRTNMSVAIVAMVNHTAIGHTTELIDDECDSVLGHEVTVCFVSNHHFLPLIAKNVSYAKTQLKFRRFRLSIRYWNHWVKKNKTKNVSLRKFHKTKDDQYSEFVFDPIASQLDPSSPPTYIYVHLNEASLIESRRVQRVVREPDDVSVW